MALKTSQVAIPTNVITTIIDKVKDTSTIAQLSPSVPQSFADDKYLVFSPSAEAEIVGEGAAKGSYEQKLKPVTGTRVKVQTTTRVSSELKWADEDNRLEIVKNIQADQAAAMARALDYVVYHAISPKTGEVVSGFDALSATAQQVTAGEDMTANIDAMAEKLMDYNIDGLALSRKLAFDLRKLRVPSTGLRLYPEIPLSLETGSVDGIKAATSNTVSGRLAKAPTNVLAFMGDFDLIKWGFVRNMTAEIIEYGDPDGQGDLKHLNQIAYRTEGMLAYAVIDPEGFSVLKSA